MNAKTPARKAKPTSPRATAKAKAPRAAADMKSVKATSTGKSPAKRPAKAQAQLAPRPPTASHRNSKQAQLIAKLGAASGTTIQQMMALTGWQAHTVRGMISGVLRKKLGLNVTCEASAESGERIYRIAASAVRA